MILNVFAAAVVFGVAFMVARGRVLRSVCGWASWTCTFAGTIMLIVWLIGGEA